jgi:hypothetical protein
MGRNWLAQIGNRGGVGELTEMHAGDSGGLILGCGERGNLMWNVLHGGGWAAGGERRGGHRPVVVATG